jgi:diaminohydroxyphosphoribosylaminopyrimidine deaminase/5-amino-6-(5-phosphoribosylamino)uracil reductase
MEEGQKILAPFAKWITRGIPFVTLKMGMTLDGRIADAKMASRWITSPAARAEVRRMRQRSDAIMVGRNTAVQDNPSLRWSASERRNPKRIIVDSSGKLSPKAQVFSDGQAGNTIVVTTRACSDERMAEYVASGATVWRCGRGRQVSLKILMDKLGSIGVMNCCAKVAENWRGSWCARIWWMPTNFLWRQNCLAVVGCP